MRATEAPIAVTGASGGVGRRVAARLGAHGRAQRLIVRDLAAAPVVVGADAVQIGPAGYRDKAGMADALRGTETLLLVSARASEQRVVEHAEAIEAAVDAGVARIVYTSRLGADPDATFTFAQDHFATEHLIRESGLAFTFLRNSQYLDAVPLIVGGDGTIRGPAGEGRIAWVSRDDVADVTTAVLRAGGEHDGRTYDVTGRESHTMAWAAQQLSAVTGREIAFRNQGVQEAYEARAHLPAADFELDGEITAYVAVGTGEMDVVSDTVERIAGHPAQDLPDWLKANPESWAHLRA